MAIVQRKRKDGKSSYLVRIPDYSSGKRRNVTVGTYHTKKAAEVAERDALHKRDNGAAIDVARLTVGELMDSWFSAHRGTISSQSAVDYETTIRLHIKPALGNVRLSSLNAARLRQQYQEWQEAGKSPDTIQKCHQRLKQALNQAVEDRTIPANPLANVRPPRSPKKTMQYLSPEETRRFLDASREHKYFPLWHFLVLEGMRVGEALGLRWIDMHFDDTGATAHIQQQASQDKANKGKVIIQFHTKTKGSSRTVRLADETLAALKLHRSQLQGHPAQMAIWDERSLIVSTDDGRPVNPSNVDRAMAVVMREAGIDRRIRVHDLRHTCATLLLKAGEPVKVVSERLGHSNTRTTLDHYAQVMPGMQQETASAWNAILPPTTTTQS